MLFSWWCPFIPNSNGPFFQCHLTASGHIEPGSSGHMRPGREIAYPSSPPPHRNCCRALDTVSIDTISFNIVYILLQRTASSRLKLGGRDIAGPFFLPRVAGIMTQVPNDLDSQIFSPFSIIQKGIIVGGKSWSKTYRKKILLQDYDFSLNF